MSKEEELIAVQLQVEEEVGGDVEEVGRGEGCWRRCCLKVSL